MSLQVPHGPLDRIALAQPYCRYTVRTRQLTQWRLQVRPRLSRSESSAQEWLTVPRRYFRQTQYQLTF